MSWIFSNSAASISVLPNSPNKLQVQFHKYYNKTPATKDEEYSKKSTHNTASLNWQVQIWNGYCQASTKKYALSGRVL